MSRGVASKVSICLSCLHRSAYDLYHNINLMQIVTCATGRFWLGVNALKSALVSKPRVARVTASTISNRGLGVQKQFSWLNLGGY